ncbi:MAG: hypothetical protein HN348_22875 [Proteobacteria bacterium]|nr:hypothetical protein [Pseudomonadota bacterium]
MNVDLTATTSSAESGHGGDLLIDSSTRSFWAAEKEGEQEVTFSVGSYGVSSIGITPGPKTHARPKKVEVGTSSSSRSYLLEDKAETQWFMVPPLVGYTGSSWGDLMVKVVETYPATTEGKGVAIAEVKLRATNVEDF